MGIAKGGRIEQEIYEDKFDANDWDLSCSTRCWVHLCNSESWKQITGEKPPHKPFSAKEYIQEGLPWFDYYSENKGIPASKVLKGVKSVSEFSNQDLARAQISPRRSFSFWTVVDPWQACRMRPNLALIAF
jgi:hypothetical protein